MAQPASSDENAKGLAFILSNPIKDPSNSQSHSQYATMMEDLWQNQIGCELFQNHTYVNIDGKEMAETLAKLANTDASKFEYLVIVIIAHGGLVESDSNKSYSPGISGKDDKWILEDDILPLFYNTNTSWRGKKKLFILCYSRFSEIRGAKNKIVSSRTNVGKLSNTTGNKSPTITDFLLVYGSSTHFLSEIYGVFSNEWRSQTVHSMLTMVNGNCWPRTRTTFESSITEDFFLYPMSQQNRESTVVDGHCSINLGMTSAISERLRSSDYYGEIGSTTLAVDLSKIVLSNFDRNTPVWKVQQQLQNMIGPEQVHRIPLKGRVLLICNDLGPNSENAHVEDEEMMTQLWRHTLECDVITKVDSKVDEMEKQVEEFSMSDASIYDYAVVIISSHGGLSEIPIAPTHKPSYANRSFIQGAAGKLIDERKILSYFDKDDSPWHDKPKLFILDYCRGKLKDDGVAKVVITEPPPVVFEIDDRFIPDKITCMVENSYIIHATNFQYVAFPNYLTTAVKNVFMKHWKSKSMVEMLTLVNDEMKGVQGKYMAMSVFKSTAKKEFYLYRAQTH